MNIITSAFYLVLGVTLHLLPAYAASDVGISVAASETSARGFSCIALGYVFCAIGAWMLLKEMKRLVAPALARGFHHIFHHVFQHVRIRGQRKPNTLAHA